MCGLAAGPVSAGDGVLTIGGLAAADVSTTGSSTNGEPPHDGPVWRPFFALRDKDRGIDIDPVYYGECFTNARGGISTAGAAQYLGLLDLPLTLDFQRLRVPVPGKFFLLAQNTHGRGLTEDFVGDKMVLSNIDSAHNIMQVGEYWWEFGVLDDAVTLRLGKQDVNDEFFLMDSASDFIQSGFTLSPNANLPSYPHQAMAAVALVQLAPSLQCKVGVWDKLAPAGSWGFSGRDTILVTGEIEYGYALQNGRLPGRIAIGGLYFPEGALLREPFGAGHGYNVQLEQQVFREHEDRGEDDSAGDVQGLAIFAAFYPRFPGEPVLAEDIGDSFAAGVVYRGLLPRRDADVLGAGLVWAELFQGGTNRETAMEAFYRAAITDHVSLQPDVQYIVTPSGIYPDALALGLRLQVNL
jgi:porin